MFQRSKESHSNERGKKRNNQLVVPISPNRVDRLSLDRWTVGPLDRWTVVIERGYRPLNVLMIDWTAGPTGESGASLRKFSKYTAIRSTFLAL